MELIREFALRLPRLKRRGLTLGGVSPLGSCRREAANDRNVAGKVYDSIRGLIERLLSPRLTCFMGVPLTYSYPIRNAIKLRRARVKPGDFL